MPLKKYYLFLLCIAHCILCTSQNKNELLANYKDNSQADTAKLATTLALVKAYLASNPDSNFIFSLQALRLAELTANKKIEAKLCWHLVGIYLDKNNYQKALEYTTRALKINETGGVEINYSSVAAVFSGLERHKKALFYFEKALELSKQQRDLKGIAVGLNNIASCYINQGLYAKAERYLLEALKIDTERKLTENFTDYYSNLGYVNECLKNYDKSLSYYYKALKQVKKERINQTLYLPAIIV